MKRIIYLLLIIALSVLTTGCNNTSSEIILYLPQGFESFISFNQETFVPVKSDMIDNFNTRLKELKINSKLVVKTYDNKMALDNKDNFIDLLLERDSNADIVLFDQTYVDQLMPLDSYYKTQEGKDILSYYSDEYIDRLKINGSLYLVPKIVYPLTKQYVQKKDCINDFDYTNILNLTDFLNRIYEKYSVDHNFYISDLAVSQIVSDKYQHIDNSELNPLFLRKSDKKVVNAFEEQEILNVMRLINKLHQAGFTGKGLSYSEYSTMIEKQDSILEFGDDFIFNPDKDNRVYMDKEQYCAPGGLSILKKSNQAEEAFKILWAIYTDKECSSCFQSPKNQTYFGSFDLLGNNYLISSTSNQPDNKLDYYMDLEKQSDVDQSLKYPLLFDLSKEVDKIEQYEEIVSLNRYFDSSTNKNIFKAEHAFDEVAYEKYLQTVREKLKEVGIDKTISNLQEQVDDYGT